MKFSTSTIALLLCLMISVFAIAQQKQLDSLIQVTTSTKDSLHINQAADLVYEMNKRELFDDALQYCDTLIGISKKIKYYKGVGKIYNEKAYLYNQTDQLYQALKCFDHASYYFKKVNFDRGLAIIQNNKAVIEQKLGNPEKSITHLLEANLYYEKLKDSTSLAVTINNVGNVHLDLNQIEDAKKCYFKSIALKEQTNSNLIGPTYNNLASAYVNQSKLDSALVILDKSLVKNKEEGNDAGMAEAYILLGEIAYHKKEYDKAKKYYESSLQIGGKVEYQLRLIRTKLSLGEIAMKTNNYNEAARYLSEARETSEAINSTPLLLDSYELLAKLDSTRGNYKDAYAWSNRYKQLYEDHTLNESSKKIDLIRKRLENEKKHQALLDKRKIEKQQADKALFKQKVYTYIAIAAFIVAIIFIIGIIKTRLQRVKYIKELNESNQVKDKLFSIISHDLKNEIHGLDSTLNLLKDDMISESEFKEIIPVLSTSAHQTSILLTNLLNWSKSQMNSLNAKPSDFDFSEIVNDKFAFFANKASNKGIQLINNLTGFTKVFADKDMCTIVVQNLIANAVKFCSAGDSITISKEEAEDQTTIYFEDTGVGITEENITKIFSDITLTTKGTHNESGTGLGLKICRELIKLNRGDISVQSSLGVGSTFCVTLPKC
ncbi:tetratricopeptide repeat protein [Aquimarina brevivitae]|uniref:histidine kinase n=1 Tax=Aquimarina brevivitae TaxID=323412 RepID=A0A4Q7P1M8_9FLAO|nr:tetratricopeptide repeat protein [Aquimarina brevivitae]RZS93228.1 tetratricopeptide repeat protein [Aquimarina brevivitae]